MAIDLQNMPHQTEYLDSKTKPRFCVGRELATMITSCGILDQAWQEIYNVSKNNVDLFCLKEDKGVAYVTFPSFSGTTEDFTNTVGKYGEYNIQKEGIFNAYLRGDDYEPAYVHKGALNRFQHIRESSDFIKKIEDLKSEAIIFVGHSMGGAVASLATLWYLQDKEKHESSCFCITFGSPLVGNSIFAEAIGRQGWTGKFCHVVSKYDIVPRVLLAPFESIAEPLNVPVPHWERIMRTDCVAVTHPIPRLLEKVLPYTSAPKSPYIPFGTYMFCSTQGAACIDDSEAVLKMLHLTLQEMQGMPFDQLEGNPALVHTAYGLMLEAMTKNLLNAMPIANNDTDSFELGIVLELEAMAIGPQDKPHASSALREAEEKKNQQDMNIEKLNNDLSKMQCCMAEVEWYKERCKRHSGYYDSFRQHNEEQDQHVNLVREKLTVFWEGIVEKEEKQVLPSDFRCQNKWINAGTAYRRLVEPLDIAHHYRTRKDNKKYLEVRPHHHIVLEYWMVEKEKTRTKKKRTKFASLTPDSRFWALVEEARQVLTSLPQENVRTTSLIESLSFEKHISKMISEKSISEEVFLEGSSFMTWWEKYSSYLHLHFPDMASKSDLFDFMQNEKWK